MLVSLAADEIWDSAHPNGCSFSAFVPTDPDSFGVRVYHKSLAPRCVSLPRRECRSIRRKATHCFSPESQRALDQLPATARKACSIQIGWTSLLAQHSVSKGASGIYETHPTPDQTIVIVLKGEVDVESLNCGYWRKGVYHAGSAGITAPNASDRLRWRVRPGHQAFEKLHLFMPQTLIDEASDEFGRAGQRASTEPLSALVLRDGVLANVATTLIAAMEAGAPELYADTAARWIAVHLLWMRLGLGESASARHVLPLSDKRLSRALEFMSGNLSRPVTLDAIASEAGVSKFHFTRLFREAAGETPVQHLLGLRLEAAARLLATSDLPIYQVASECGYPNVTNFNGAFRRRYGCTPKQYRRRR